MFVLAIQLALAMMLIILDSSSVFGSIAVWFACQVRVSVVKVREWPDGWTIQDSSVGISQCCLL